MTASAQKALADRAHQLALAEPMGVGRKAWACAAIALATTSNPAAARKALSGWDGPADVKAAALEALGQLTHLESA